MEVLDDTTFATEKVSVKIDKNKAIYIFNIYK